MKADDTVLDRWGLIADHLKVSVMTAMRYRKRGLPVIFDPAGHPVTTKTKLDEWKFGKPRSEFFETPTKRRSARFINIDSEKTRPGPGRDKARK